MKWADDKDTDHCQFCKQAFSISRRKVSEAYHVAKWLELSSCNYTDHN